MVSVAHDQSFPLIEQISFFLPNKVGSLQRVVNSLNGAGVRVCGMAILDAHDHAVVRMVVDRPGKAVETLESQGRAVCTTRLLGISVDDTDSEFFEKLLDRLLCAELNVYYTYALFVRHAGSSVMVLHSDDVDSASHVVSSGGFDIVVQRDLELLG